MSKTQPDHANVRATKAPMTYRSCVVCSPTVHQQRHKFLRLGVRAGPAGSLTTDNGREFAQHERIAATLDADFFFAHPYSSWERGANENMNGLIRQFFPKKIAFNLITKKDIEMAMHRLNHRPRKCLGYRTSHKVFMEQFQLHNQSVALQT